MNYRTKKQPGDVINNYTLIEHVKDCLWKARCSCGEEYIRRADVMKKQRYCTKCKPKLKNNEHYSWRGCGEISHELLTTYKHSAIAKNLEFSITVEYLWKLFIKQNRKCTFTGEELYFYKTSDTKPSKTASLDRIDSTKGYVEGNLQWVHRDVNKLKKNFSDERFIEICLKVAEFKNKLK